MQPQPTPLIHTRITDLTPRLMAYARFVHSIQLDLPDVQQEMFLALLEKDRKQPAFASQTDAYLVRYALWMAQHAAEKTWTYDSHVARTVNQTREAHNGRAQPDRDYSSDEIIFYDLTPDPDAADPAEVTEQRETLEALLSAVQEMSPSNQTLVKMIYLGYSESEIAEHLGISRPAVTQRKATIARAVKK